MLNAKTAIDLFVPSFLVSISGLFTGTLLMITFDNISLSGFGTRVPSGCKTGGRLSQAEITLDALFLIIGLFAWSNWISG